MEQKIIIGTGIILFNKKKEILLVKEQEEKLGGKKDKWGIIGGKLEVDLTLEKNAIKEVYEETGYNITIDGLVGVYQHIDKTYNRLSFIFRATSVNKVSNYDIDEISEIKWFKINEIPFNDLRFDHNKEMIKDAISYLSEPAFETLNTLKYR